MKKNPSDVVNIDRIKTTRDVLKELRRLTHRLATPELEQFSLFNLAYTIVTRRILHAIQEGYFKEPQLIDAFIVIFVGYYFEALNDIANHNLSTSSPWSKMREYAHIQAAPVFLSLLLGANAHINYDLPLALKRFVDQRSDDHSLTDLAKISKILMQSGIEITDSFEEPNIFYNFLKRRLRFTYYRPAMYTILYWRIVAWREYKRLQRSNQTLSHISKRSNRIANRLLRITQVLS